jgi:hypothetical protein
MALMGYYESDPGNDSPALRNPPLNSTAYDGLHEDAPSTPALRFSDILVTESSGVSRDATHGYSQESV